MSLGLDSDAGLTIESLYQTAVDMLTDEKMWIGIGVVFLKVIFILLAAYIVVIVARVVIRKTFSVRIRGPLKYNERRQQTLSKLLENIVAYVVYFVAIIAVLSAFTIDITGLIAGSSVWP